ncbi:tripartite tricarboxylate transporter TctB family protein [Pseudochelatococcus sp. B33]
MSEERSVSLPGTLAFFVFLALGSLILVYEAYGIQGLPTISGPGIFPLIAAGTMAVIALGLSAGAILYAPRSKADDAGNGRAPLSEVISPLILAYSGFCLIYILALEPVGFWISSAVFLPISFVMLYSRNPIRIGAITVLVLAFVYVVFAYIFRVYLP